MQVRCRFCGKEYYKPAGYRYNKKGRRKLYKCLVCGRKFTPDSAFLGMMHDPDTLNQCVNMYLYGLSYRKISQYMKNVMGVEISHTCIYKWIRKFSGLLKPYTDSFRVNGQDTYLNTDETMIRIKGEWGWSWNTINKENRFILASRISKTRDMGDAKALFKEAKDKLNGMPMRITTDGMMAYPRAFRSTFYTRSYPCVEHYVAPGITSRHHNNLIERHHSSIKERIKTMRGFGGMDSASDMMDFWNIWFNYLRYNMALGSTPAESAGLGSHNLIEMIEEAHEWKKRMC